LGKREKRERSKKTSGIYKTFLQINLEIYLGCSP
jgi:hypothetical protein